MKACAGVAGIVVGLAIVVLAALYLMPRLKAGSATHAASSGPASSGFGPPAERIDAPKSDTDRMREDIDRKRIPFYHMIHDKFADQIERAAVLKDVDTLDLVVKKDDAESLQWIVANAIGPTARDYGFTHVRFYVRNAVGTVEPYKVVAESSWDGAARWNTFMK